MAKDEDEAPSPPIDDVYVYVGGEERDESREEQVGIRRNRFTQDHLAIVRIDDSEIDRIHQQIKRIVLRLDTPDKDADGSHFAVDSITAHVGLSASGNFFFVASAGIEAALDITWRRG